MSALERKQNKPYSEILEAARVLTKKGLLVIVDCSEGAVPLEPVTHREYYINMDPMSPEQIDAMPDLKNFLDFLKSNNLYNEVFILILSK